MMAGIRARLADLEERHPFAYLVVFATAQTGLIAAGMVLGWMIQ